MSAWSPPSINRTAESAIVDLTQSARGTADAIIINPAAYSFTSVAIYDALKIFEGPIVEVHISNIHARDELHRHSRSPPPRPSVICGMGPYGYHRRHAGGNPAGGQAPDALPAHRCRIGLR